MSLRKRLALVAAAAVAIAVVVVATVSYTAVRSNLRGQVDDALRAQQAVIRQDPLTGLQAAIPSIPAKKGGPAQYAELVFPSGTASVLTGDVQLPNDARANAVANGDVKQYMTDINVNGTHLRVFVFPVEFQFGNGSYQPAALELARPLDGVDSVLSNLRLVLILVVVGGSLLAFVLGRFAARRVLAPLAEVADTATEIGETDDLSRRLAIHADDEVGQLARRFNVMLERLQASREALDQSVQSQRQLVADASHELRTPVTSLRTNVEVLLAGGVLDEEDRGRLLTDVHEQSEELSRLVADLIELARGDRPIDSPEEVRLDQMVTQSVAWARRNNPGIRFETSLAPVQIDGIPERLERAINNLLDNAAHHSPPAGLVEVTVDADGVMVRDHGGGVAEEDLPHVFDRFFRGSNNRGRQGSGLGLAIVKQVAEQHHGSVRATNAGDGGAVFFLALPTIPGHDDDEPEPVEPTVGSSHRL